jgi:hypothetical protein
MKGCNISRAPLQFFKLFANNREKHIVDNGRPQEGNTEEYSSSAAENVSVHRSSGASSLTGQRWPGFIQAGNSYETTLDGNRSTASTSRHSTVRLEYLDDPFVAPTIPVSLLNSICGQLRKDNLGLKGSMEFEYEFPFKLANSKGLTVARASSSTVIQY